MPFHPLSRIESPVLRAFVLLIFALFSLVILLVVAVRSVGIYRTLEFPALRHIIDHKPDFFVGTGDSVYYDIFPLAATTQAELRAHWHRQFSKPLFVELFANVATYWEKDDHDHRYNDSDTAGDLAPSNTLGIRTFLEQVPVVDPDEPSPVTYRSHRINKHLQIWLTEGRDYRSPNAAPPGPSKAVWGDPLLEIDRQSRDVGTTVTTTRRPPRSTAISTGSPTSRASSE
jgi:phosphodiesterase/alkaline phosphatase D-like protein